MQRYTMVAFLAVCSLYCFKYKFNQQATILKYILCKLFKFSQSIHMEIIFHQEK